MSEPTPDENVRLGEWLRMMLGHKLVEAENTSGPFVHTFTPRAPHWSDDTPIAYPSSDAEWEAMYWFEENDAETSALTTLPEPAFTFYVGDGPDPREDSR